MSPKFNRPRTSARGSGPIVTLDAPVLTHEGGVGHARDLKSELFMLAVSNMVGEGTFYETADDRDLRYELLVRQAAAAHPEWTAGLLGWLRGDGNLRSASLVGAAIFVHQRLAGDKDAFPGLNRKVINSVLQRADEPGEMLSYWMSSFGRAIPKPVKRGVADAVGRLYNERALLKYDTGSHGLRFGDVLELTHPSPKTSWQGDLFVHALNRRHNRANGIPETLRMVRRNALLRSECEPTDWLSSSLLFEAGMTWEDALSAVGSKVDKAKLWEAMIPSMGYMALLRNLRNFDEAGVSDEAAGTVVRRLTNPDQVATSRQFPYRFLSAYENAPSLRWSQPLDEALNLSLANVPKLDGKNLVLIDTSASMTHATLSGRSTMTIAKAAAVFGIVLGMRSGADVYGFANGQFQHKLPKGASALKEINKFVARTGEVGHGTEIAAALRATWKGHKRVFIVSDEQTMGGSVTNAVSPDVAVYGFNLGGYRTSALVTGPNRVELGGLSDSTFRLVPLIEAGRNANWPWMG